MYFNEPIQNKRYGRRRFNMERRRVVPRQRLDMRKKALLTALVITVLTGCTQIEKCAAYTDRDKPERGWDYRDYYPNTQTVYYYAPVTRD